MKNGSIPLKHLRSEHLLKQSEQLNLRRGYRVHVCSFCGAADGVHWLHYGRAGTGVAIGFDSNALQRVHQFTLHSVIYETEEQDELRRTIIQLVDDCAGRFSARSYDEIGQVFAELAVEYLRYAAPRMKDVAFKSESEWRLVSMEAWVRRDQAEDPTRKTLFRSTNGRVVPYKEIEFASLPLSEIILGWSSPMEIDEQGLAVLMETSLGKTFPITKSAVEVRP